MPNQFDVPVRVGSTQKQAMVFVHGFSGYAHKTFGMLPAFRSLRGLVPIVPTATKSQAWRPPWSPK